MAGVRKDGEERVRWRSETLAPKTVDEVEMPHVPASCRGKAGHVLADVCVSDGGAGWGRA